MMWFFVREVSVCLYKERDLERWWMRGGEISFIDGGWYVIVHLSLR